MTCPPFVEEGLQAIVDIPFLALILWAAALEAERPRRGGAVVVLLGMAGRPRPEAWVLVGAYAIYLSWGGPVVQLVRWGAIAAVAPLLWLGFDLLATGDPFHSLHGTQDLASRLGRPRGADTALLKRRPPTSSSYCLRR